MENFTKRAKKLSTDLETNPVCQATQKRKVACDFCLFLFLFSLVLFLPIQLYIKSQKRIYM